MRSAEKKREERVTQLHARESSQGEPREISKSPLNKRRAARQQKKQANSKLVAREESLVDEEELAVRDLAFSRISAHSKVNFTKLTDNEKMIRYENMMKELT